MGDLYGVIPLDTGAPFEVVEEREVWHPNWRGKVDDTVNAQFLKVVVDRIWQNEQVSIYIILSAYVLTFSIEYLEGQQQEGRNRR